MNNLRRKLAPISDPVCAQIAHHQAIYPPATHVRRAEAGDVDLDGRQGPPMSRRLEKAVCRGAEAPNRPGKLLELLWRKICRREKLCFGVLQFSLPC
jgi:hypothetical protein